MPRTWKYILIFLASTALLTFVAALSLADSRLHLVFCDVGQGDAILIYRGSTQILVDGGPDREVLSCLSRHMLFWDRKIELVLLSHPDADHYGGLVDVVRRYQIVSFVDSGVRKDDVGFETLEVELKNRSINTITVETGTMLRAGSAELLTSWPPRGVLGASTTGKVNEYSVVLHLRYGEFDALLTGDIEPPATDLVASRAKPVEVLKVPHHGSKNGLTEALLEATQPKLAVISVGKDNRYGHPHKEIINLLDGYMIKRTDLDGEVEIVTDGRVWWLR